MKRKTIDDNYKHFFMYLKQKIKRQKVHSFNVEKSSYNHGQQQQQQQDTPTKDP